MFKTIEAKASYGIGLQIGQQLKESGMQNLELNALTQGLIDVMNDKQPAVALEELHDSLRQFHENAMKAREVENEKTIEQNLNFLKQNLEKENIKSTESGLQYQIIEQGSGPIPTEADRVSVHYTGRLIDGTIFDSSKERGEPAEFPVNGVIKGWVEALQLMPVGSKWKLYIPQELAYGAQGAGSAILPYSTLIFDIELLSIN